MERREWDGLLVELSGRQDMPEILQGQGRYEKLYRQAQERDVEEFRQNRGAHIRNILKETLHDPLVEDEAGEGPQ